ncbi:PIN domain-containing protein [Streptomyces sp. NBC_01602]|uniref:PIN domain-containing protein n=1 Tax=Streptomyces sp. NBC_01602 TaxID=2975893 RepID=UPI00386EC019
MIALLDTTAFVADPLCSGTAWRVLAHAASTWNVRLVVPEVVIREAVAGYRRRTAEALVGLQRQKDKNGGALGISAIYDKARADIETAALRYPEDLQELLREIGAQILAPPAVGHLELVERSTQRKKPCDGNGNGYRDTLNWISVLETAKGSSEDVVWISDNSKDFGREDGEGLHDDLAAEVTAIDAEGRIKWLKSLSELILELTSERWPEFSDDLRRIQERLQSDSMEGYLNKEILAGCMERAISPRMCGLPIQTRSARIMAVGALTESTFSVRGASAEDEGIIEFTAVCPTTALMDLPVTADIDGLEVDAITDDGVTVWVSKDLHFTGIVTSDRYGRPVSGEVTRISASPDDPGRNAWSRTSASGPLLESLHAAMALDPKILASFRDAMTANSKLNEALRNSLIDPKILEAMRKPLIDPKLMAAMRKPLIDPKLMAAMRKPLIDPKLMAAMRKPLIDPKLTEAIRIPVAGLGALEQFRNASLKNQDSDSVAEDGGEEASEEPTSEDDDSSPDK